MADSPQRDHTRKIVLRELCAWTFILVLGLWELTRPTAGFGAWFQTSVAAMGVVKSGWTLRADTL